MNDEANSTSGSSAPAFLEQLIQRASDIHLQMFGKSAQVSLRLDGLMAPPVNLPEPSPSASSGVSNT